MHSPVMSIGMSEGVEIDVVLTDKVSHQSVKNSTKSSPPSRLSRGYGFIEKH
jgi:hypothetical protein